MQGDIINCDYLDCISTNGNGDKGVIGRGSKELGKAMFASFQRLAIHDSGKPMYQGSPFVGNIEGLDPSIAFAISDTFFMTLFRTTRAAPPRSVNRVDGQTFGEITHGV